MKFADSLGYYLPRTQRSCNKSRTIRMSDLIGILFGNRLIQQKTTGTVPVVFCFCLFHILDGIQLNKIDNSNFGFLMISS